MFEYLPLQHVSSSAGREGFGKRLLLIGLSTCGFCNSAKRFLQAEGLPFSWVNLDEVTPELKARAKADFTARFGDRVHYPSLVIDEESFIPGFIEVAWRRELS